MAARCTRRCADSAWWLLVPLSASAFTLWALAANFRKPTASMNDALLHRVAVAHAAAHGPLWPPDPWLPSIGCGFPLFAHYQHAPHAA